MRRSLAAGLLVAALSVVSTSAVFARGPGPQQLADAGWDCFLPPPEFNPNVHCAPPGQLAKVISGEARAATFMAFATTDLASRTAELLGTERLIRSDLYNGQPCPTDPPSFEYSSLFPRFGWAYHICHTFESPW